ncbi:MAG: hypothetical protein ACRYFZ_07300 [Janthinobacterium lividum]
MSRPYHKHYPPEAAPSPARRWLLALLRRTPGRRARWRSQAQRRRPWVLRPLTVGETRVLHLRTAVDELALLLGPFRQSRARGHEPLRPLLHDPETAPAVAAQVQQLEACLHRLSVRFTQERRELDGWVKEWDHATETRKNHLRLEQKSHAISALLRALNMLTEEAMMDIKHIQPMNPDAFKPEAPPEPWLDSAAPAGPAPYSA